LIIARITSQRHKNKEHTFSAGHWGTSAQRGYRDRIEREMSNRIEEATCRGAPRWQKIYLLHLGLLADRIAETLASLLLDREQT
jgi:hypothetical protein